MASLSWIEILTQIFIQFVPVWVAMALTLGVSYFFRDRLGLYGRIFDTFTGSIGFALVIFWIFTAIFADLIITFDPIDQLSRMRKKSPGTLVPDTINAYLLGGDLMGRDVFSRMVMGSRIVLSIAPAATIFAFMTGITLGLPAGFYGKKLDTILSFIANLVLAFPVILLFYLLVNPAIRSTGIPIIIAAVLFLFPIIFFAVLFQSRYYVQPMKRNIYVGLTLLLGFWAYSGLAFNQDPLQLLGLEPVFYMDPNLLNIFVSVVFVNSPTVFRIVRGLTMDIKTRDYVAAAIMIGIPVERMAGLTKR
jgi:peptide/nickel transport system permease protein